MNFGKSDKVFKIQHHLLNRIKTWSQSHKEELENKRTNLGKKCKIPFLRGLNNAINNHFQVESFFQQINEQYVLPFPFPTDS